MYLAPEATPHAYFGYTEATGSDTEYYEHCGLAAEPPVADPVTSESGEWYIGLCSDNRGTPHGP